MAAAEVAEREEHVDGAIARGSFAIGEGGTVLVPLGGLGVLVVEAAIADSGAVITREEAEVRVGANIGGGSNEVRSDWKRPPALTEGSWYGGRTQACSTCSVTLKRLRQCL